MMPFPVIRYIKYFCPQVKNLKVMGYKSAIDCQLVLCLITHIPFTHVKGHTSIKNTGKKTKIAVFYSLLVNNIAKHICTHRSGSNNVKYRTNCRWNVSTLNYNRSVVNNILTQTIYTIIYTLERKNGHNWR